MEKGDLPPFMEDKKDEKLDSSKDEEKDDEKEDDDMKDDEAPKKMYKDETAKSDGYSDVITSEYLSWMENTLKSQGVNIGEARTHFDDVAKANLGSTPEQFPEEQMNGQVKGRMTPHQLVQSVK